MARKLKFEQTERDTQGNATWEITLNGEYVGRIEKSTVWCGDGYCADGYDVQVETVDDLKEECFQVANIWTRGNGMTARVALAACKAFARQVLGVK